MATLSSSRGWFRALCLASWGALALQACGGRSDTEDWLFDDSPRGGGRAGGPGTGGRLPGGAGTTSTVGGAGSLGGKSGNTGGVSAGGTAAGGMAAGGIAAAGTTQGGAPQGGGVAQGGASQAGSAGESWAGAPSAPVTCGSDVCDGFTEQCCATLGGIGCMPEAQACGGAVLECGSSADCGNGQVCCLALVGERGVGAECRDECRGVGAGRERQLCTSDDECRGPRRCRDTVFGISVCTRQ